MMTGRVARVSGGVIAVAGLLAAGVVPGAAAAASGHDAPAAPASRVVEISPAQLRSAESTPKVNPATPKPAVAGGAAQVPTDGSLARVGGFTLRLTAAAVARSRAATPPAAVTTPSPQVPVRVAREADGTVKVALSSQASAGASTSLAAAAAGSSVGVARPNVQWVGFRGRLVVDRAQVAPGGGDAASRLVVRDVTSCTTGKDCPIVTSAVQKTANTMSFAVTGGATYAVAAASSGEKGDYSATALAPDSTWGVNEQSGSFTWSLPLKVPSAASGQEPSLSVSYDSGSVDGRVASTNNQPSNIGEGFNLAAGGEISREYLSCSEDMTGGSNASRKTYDLCFGKDNASLVLGGKSSRLIRNTTTGKWHLKDDDGSVLERLTGGGNGDNDGEYWVLTDTAGTKYYFGLEKRYTGDTGVRNSTWTVPVNGNQSGEPCYNATFASGFCNQAWKWNLSYVVDVRGNTISYTYAKESNRYGQNLNTKSVAYDRGGYLTSIEYGQAAGSEATTTAPQRVLFTTAERCLPSGGVTCAEAQLTAANAAYWPDVPQDQICTATTTCTSSQTSPTFFTRKRLTSVKTQVVKSVAYSDVDGWDFTQSFPAPGDGTTASLWLDRVTHTGLIGGTFASPPIVFTPVQLANRVDGIDNADPFYKFRIGSVLTESGAAISVHYKNADCTPTSLPSAPDSNTRLCYPNFYTPLGASEPTLHYFHKYVVDSLVADGRVTPSQPTVTRYNYLGGAAWHYDENITAPAKKRTWSQFRGFAAVETVVGAQGDPSPLRTKTTYFRGMHGDRTAAGGTTTVAISDSQGGSRPDEDYFNGMTLESVTYDGDTEVSGKITNPWVSPVRVSDAYGASRSVRPEAVVTARQARDGKAPFTTRVTTTFDADGNSTQVADDGDTATGDDDTCTRTTYVQNTAKNLQGLPATVTSLGVSCAATATAADVIAESHTLYDGATTVTATPTRGEETETRTRADSGMVTASTTSYDTIGRPVKTTDPLGRATTTAYTPADRGPLTAMTVTNPLGHKVTTTVDPANGAPMKVVDPNSRSTAMQRDPLGRVTKVWLPNRSTTLSPSFLYTYNLTQSGVSSITTSTLHYLTSNRIVSTTLLDGLLRPVQTQTQSGAGQRVVNDTIYDSRGLTCATRGPWVSGGLPDTTVVTAPDVSIDKVVTSEYDGAARPTKATTWVLGEVKQVTSSMYNGDSIDTIVPDGGIATRTVLDARGRTTARWQYHGNTVTADKDVTTTSYNRKNQVTAITNHAGTTWTYEYDQLGRQTKVTDPDKGATRTEYDAAGQVVRSTDAHGQVINRSYDLLGRPLTVTAGASNPQNVAAWTYDTAPIGIGQLTSATSYSGGQAYTTKVEKYDALYNPTQTTVTIPAAETGLAGSYTTTSNYNVDGSLGFVNMPAIANLPAEQYSYQRDATNLPKTLTASQAIVAGSTRDGLGRLTQYTLQTLDAGTHVTSSYETGLGRLATYRVDRDNVAKPDQNATFTYDASGRITSIADTPDPDNAAKTDRQCFAYDWAGRLTEAWAGGDTTCSAQPTLSNTGAAPYWTSWTYQDEKRASETRHATTAETTAVARYAYPAATAARPHATTRVTTVTGEGTSAETTTSADLTYDETGNTLTTPLPSGGTGTLTWDELGRMATTADSSGTTSHVYDADGGLLIRRAADGTRTLFLGHSEVTYTPAKGATPAATTAVRLFSFEGQIVAIRTATGSNGVIFQPPGYQGTSLVQTSGAGGTLQVRRYSPFGAPRGTTTGTGTAWIGDHGFLGATGATTAGSGLVHLGAREYDPILGRFQSVDPVMDLDSPQQWNAYSYSGNSPITYSDPSGERFCADDCSSGDSYVVPHTKKVVIGYKQKAYYRKQAAHARWRSTLSRAQRARYDAAVRAAEAARKARFAAWWAAVSGRAAQERAAAQAEQSRSWWDGVKDAASWVCEHKHDILDACGMAPGIGAACDAANAISYAFEGDYGNALLSATATVPGIGDAVGGAKIAAKGALYTVDAAADLSKAVVKYDADFALGQITRGGKATASQLEEFGTSQGWARKQSDTGPISFTDDNNVKRLTIKQGSARTPGSENPHVEVRNAAGTRVDPYGNAVSRRSPGNHTPIIWDR